MHTASEIFHIPTGRALGSWPFDVSPKFRGCETRLRDRQAKPYTLATEANRASTKGNAGLHRNKRIMRWYGSRVKEGDDGWVLEICIFLTQ